MLFGSIRFGSVVPRINQLCLSVFHRAGGELISFSLNTNFFSGQKPISIKMARAFRILPDYKRLPSPRLPARPPRSHTTSFHLCSNTPRSIRRPLEFTLPPSTPRPAVRLTHPPPTRRFPFFFCSFLFFPVIWLQSDTPTMARLVRTTTRNFCAAPAPLFFPTRPPHAAPRSFRRSTNDRLFRCRSFSGHTGIVYPVDFWPRFRGLLRSNGPAGRRTMRLFDGDASARVVSLLQSKTSGGIRGMEILCSSVRW